MAGESQVRSITYRPTYRLMRPVRVVVNGSDVSRYYQISPSARTTFPPIAFAISVSL